MCWRLFRFAFDEEFEERWQIFFAADSKAFSWVMQAGEKLYLKLMFVLASRDEALDRAKVDALIPSPREIVDAHASYPWIQAYGLLDLTSAGVRAYLKLGRDDDACDSPELPRRLISSWRKGSYLP